MRWLKFLVYAVSALLLLVIASTVVVTVIYDDDEIRNYLMTTVEKNSNARLSINGSVSVKLSLHPKVAVTDIRLSSTIDGYDIEVGELTVKVSLLSLLWGPTIFKELRLYDIVAAVKYGEKAKVTDNVPADTTGRNGYLDGLLPVVDRLGLGNLSLRLINQESGAEQLIRFDKLDFARDEKRKIYLLRGMGELAGTAYKLSGKLGTLRELVNFSTPYPVEFQVATRESSFSLEGTINQPLKMQGINLMVQANVAELSNLVDYNSDNAVSLGQIQGSLRVLGDASDIRLKEVRLSLKQADSLSLELQNASINPYTWGETGLQFKGYINDPEILNWLLPVGLPSFPQTILNATLFRKDQKFTLEDIHIQSTAPDVAAVELNGTMELDSSLDAGLISHMDLALHFSSTKTETIKPFLFDQMPELGQTSGSLRLLLKSGSLSVENLEIMAGSENTLSVNATGRVSDISLTDQPSTQTVDLMLTARASSTDELEPVIKWTLPEVRDIRFKGHLTGPLEDLKLDKVDLRAGKTSKIKFNAQGVIRLADQVGAAGEQAVNLDVVLEASSSQSLSAWAGQELPDLGPAKAKMRVSGSFDQVLLDKAMIEIGNKKGVRLVARGKPGVVDLKQGAKLRSTDMRLQLNAPSLGSLQVLESYKLPALGKVSGSAQILGEGDSYKLDKIVLITGDKNKPVLRISGKILDPLTFFGVNLRIEVDAHVYDLLTAYYKPGIKDLGQVKGVLHLSDTDGALGVHEMNVVAEKANAYRLKLSGDIGNILNRDERDADMELSIQDWTFIEQIIDRPLPEFSPVRAEGKFFAKENVSRFDGELSFGDSTINSQLSVDYSASIPRFKGLISARRVNLADIGVKPETHTTIKEEKSVIPDKKAPIFSAEPFSVKMLNQINGDLDIKVDELVGTGLSYSPLEIKLALHKGVFRAYPTRFVFEQGAVETDFSIYANQSPVRYKLKITADDVDLESIALQLQDQPVAVKGDINVNIDLTASGDSAQAIAHSLDGQINLVGEDISLLRSHVELIMRDILSWTFSSIGLREQYAVTSCGIIHLTVNQGVLTSDMIILDGKNMNLMSELKLDFRDETIDMVINPTRKNSFFSSVSPVHINGPLRDPKVNAMSANEVSSYGGLVFLPQVFIPLKALGILGNSVTDNGTSDESPCLDVGKTAETSRQ